MKKPHPLVWDPKSKKWSRPKPWRAPLSTALTLSDALDSERLAPLPEQPTRPSTLKAKPLGGSGRSQGDA